MRIKISLPSVDEITAGLDQATCSPQLILAEEKHAAAEAALADACQRLEDAGKRAEELPGKVHAGDASQAELEAAIAAHTAAEKMIPEYERAVESAEHDLQHAKLQARAAIVGEARCRRDRLQAVIDEHVAPVLEDLREVERALTRALEENAPEPQDAIERSAALRLAPPVDGIKWPVSLAAERRLHSDVIPGAPREVWW